MALSAMDSQQQLLLHGDPGDRALNLIPIVVKGAELILDNASSSHSSALIRDS
jgi:hypothetical protein